MIQFIVILSAGLNLPPLFLEGGGEIGRSFLTYDCITVAVFDVMDSSLVLTPFIGVKKGATVYLALFYSQCYQLINQADRTKSLSHSRMLEEKRTLRRVGNKYRRFKGGPIDMYIKDMWDR